MQRTSLVVGALLFQAVVVSVMLVKAVMPLWTGQDVLIMAQAVDPRDMMRGDFVALDYDINHVVPDRIGTDLKGFDWLANGQELYVALRMTDSGAVAAGIYTTRPEHGLFVKGRSSKKQYVDTLYYSAIEVSYGIEEYYTDPELAQSIERNLRSGKGLPVHLMVDDKGNARIRTIGDHGN